MTMDGATKAAVNPLDRLGKAEELYRHHHRWLIDWLGRRMGSCADAADIAQDTFTRLWAGGQDLGDVREPRAFLTVVAKRLLVNRRERQVLERTYLAALRELPEAFAPSAEERTLMLETLLELDIMLDSLPSQVRRAFLLAQLDGLGYEQIASTLQVSVRTITRYMSQAYTRCLSVLMCVPE